MITRIGMMKNIIYINKIHGVEIAIHKVAVNNINCMKTEIDGETMKLQEDRDRNQNRSVTSTSVQHWASSV